jgi:hypothetical protein
MLVRMVLARVTIQPVGDEVHTTVKTGDKLLRKKYESIPDATFEAVKLGMVEEQTRPFVEAFLGRWIRPSSGYQPTRPVDVVLVESVRPVEVDLDELDARGFRLLKETSSIDEG